MSILVTGLCTLEWGRMEFGNIGNSYVSHGFFRMLRKNLPDVKVVTTLQFSGEFLALYDVEMVDMDIFVDTLPNAQAEVIEAKRRSTTPPQQANISGKRFTSKYLELLETVDVVLDLSGDIWGDNSAILGESRFRVGLLKLQTAQMLGKRTALVASSPGPFRTTKTEDLLLAKIVFGGFDFVLNREARSRHVLANSGFDVKRTKSLACPSVMFPGLPNPSEPKPRLESAINEIGLSICGWNFLEGPFDKEPRSTSEYKPFIQIIEKILSNTNANVTIFSHSNGFNKEGKEVFFKHGRDYVLAEKLYDQIVELPNASRVSLKTELLSTQETHKFIGNLDLLVAGRAHAAIAGLCQAVPTILIDYGHGPTAHKTIGFMELYNQENSLISPSEPLTFGRVLEKMWNEQKSISEKLIGQHRTVLAQVDEMGDHIAQLASKDYVRTP